VIGAPELRRRGSLCSLISAALFAAIRKEADHPEP
jgi:hypothetical protein